MARKPYWDRGTLEPLYRSFTAKQLAMSYGCAESTILYWLGKLKIEKRKRGYRDE